ncbi:IDO-domain-containing protein [Testicularia cyperi]|uniref:IDO-domain-containing protein n=1 Tax=Testicularia cyperi TaxID=1882483 RepID=A0A317XZV4_9BASI|nr:IDO-domain-containing protein [Testicularia cyperi]
MTGTHFDDFAYSNEAGPSSPSPVCCSPSSSPSTSPRKAFYPVWPESHDDAEYFEIPPDHFLAQQRGPTKSHSSTATATATSPLTEAHRPSWTQSSSADAFSINSESTTTATTTSTVSTDVDASLSSQPLSELAHAVQAGIPAAPTPAGLVAAAQDRFVDAVPRPAGFSTINEQIPDTSTLAAADFDIDVRSGFLPPEQPVLRLSGEHEQLWEVALDEAKRIPLMQGGGGIKTTPEQRAQARRWRRHIREMAVLPLADELANDIRFARRGHVVLSFLAHFYIHSQPRKTPDAALPPSRRWLGDLFSARKSAEEIQDEQDRADELAGKFARRLPASIAVPWVQLSQKLDLPPILTYATTVLWNWAYIDPARGLEKDNLRIVETFTGTKSEEHFFLTSLLIEARGVEALELMRVSLDEAFVGDRVARRRIAGNLVRLAAVIKDLSVLMRDVRTDCDPKTFYWGIRPWFVGSDTVEAGEQPGWHFEGVDPEGVLRTFSGPSAGQSSMIHAIDVFLDVDHTRRKQRVNRPQASGDNRGADATFMERMQLYMPGHHRAFLTHLKNISFDDDEDEDDEDLAEATSFRDANIDDDVPEDPSTGDGAEAPRELPHPIRSLAIKARDEIHDEGLPEAYDNALQALKGLRDEHMKVAYLYIIAQARGSPPDEFSPLPKGFTGEPDLDRRIAAKARAETETALDTSANDDGGGAKGTGGTDLVSFLRDCRVNTIDTLITAKNAARDAVSRAVTEVSASASIPLRAAAIASCSPSQHSSGNDASSGITAGQSPTLPISSAAFGSKPDQSEGRKTSNNTTDDAEPSLISNADGLGDSQLQIWAVDISDWVPESDTAFRKLVEVLLPAAHSADDRAKVLRYYKQIDRSRSLVARLLPRWMLHRHFGIAFDAARFAATTEGRPYLLSPTLPAHVDFNVSHDTDWIVMAFWAAPSRTADASALLASASASSSRVGIDVMSLQLPHYETTVRSFAETMDIALTPDELRWVLAPLNDNSSTISYKERERDSLHRLYRFWTYKEAFTKNIGKGLGFDFTTVRMDFERPADARDSLRIRGVPEPAYNFVDILMPPSGGGSGANSTAYPSQLVVCHGPHDAETIHGQPQIEAQMSADAAKQQGLLTVWTMEELLDQIQSVIGVAASQDAQNIVHSNSIWSSYSRAVIALYTISYGSRCLIDLAGAFLVETVTDRKELGSSVYLTELELEQHGNGRPTDWTTALGRRSVSSATSGSSIDNRQYGVRHPPRRRGSCSSHIGFWPSSAVSQASAEKPYFEERSGTTEPGSDPLLEAIQTSISSSYEDDLQHDGAGKNGLGAQWPTSSLLVLPSSFGTLFLGETFRAYLCVRNESGVPVREPSLRIEMQIGDSAAASSSSRPDAAPRWAQLGHLILPSPTSQDPAGNPIWELPSNGAMETTAAYDIKDLGAHVLVCTVGYKMPVLAPATAGSPDRETIWQERSFRKFYKFSVPTSPISVRTKVHNQRSAMASMHPDVKVRDRVALEVQVQNISGSSLVFDGLTLRPSRGWNWISEDRPSVTAARKAISNTSDEQAAVKDAEVALPTMVDMWKGSQALLADGDVRQYLFTLTPATSAAEREAAAVDLGVSPEGHHLVGDPIGHLNVSWRMSQGEPGRLQTSQLLRRRVAVPAVDCTRPRKVLTAIANKIASTESIAKQGSTISTTTSTPDPILTTQLTLHEKSLKGLNELHDGMEVHLAFDLCVGDESVARLAVSNSSRRPSLAASQSIATGTIDARSNLGDNDQQDGSGGGDDHDDDDDDDDDDKPLSQLAASPKMRAKALRSISTNSNAGLDTESEASTGAGLKSMVLSRRLRIAVQHCTVERASEQMQAPRLTLDGLTLDGSTTPKRTGSTASNRSFQQQQNSGHGANASSGSPSSGLLGGGRSKLQSNLSNLVRNSSLSVANPASTLRRQMLPRSSMDNNSVSDSNSNSNSNATPEYGHSAPISRTSTPGVPPALPPKTAPFMTPNQSQQSAHYSQTAAEDALAYTGAEEVSQLPPPVLPWSRVLSLYREHLESNTQALSRPANVGAPETIPASFLPSVSSSDPGGSEQTPFATVDFVGSSLVVLPDVEINIPVRVDPTSNRVVSASVSDGHSDHGVKFGSTGVMSFAETYLISVDPSAIDGGELGDSHNDGVVRFGAFRILLLGWSDQICAPDAAAASRHEDEDAGHYNELPTAITLKEIPVVAEGILS